MAFGALRHRNFRLFFVGHLVSLVGWWMHQVAQPWLVLTLTDSAFYVGLVMALGTLPVTVFSLVGGAIADRFPKRHVVLATQSAAMVVALLLAAVVLADVVRLGHVIVAAAALGVIGAFDIPGRQAFLIELVGKRDLVSAIALNSSAFNASRIVGPAAAGLLIATVGIGFCFVLNGLSFVAVLLALAIVRVSPAASALQTQSALSTIVEGLVYVWRERAVRTLIVMLATASVFGFSYQVVLPVFARDSLGLDARAYGWMVAAPGIGALVGGLLLAGVGHRMPRRPAVVAAAVGFGLAVATLAFVRSYPLLLVLLVGVGFAMILQTAIINTMLQMMAPDALRGRVLSVYTLAFIGLSPVGALVAGTVAERASPEVVFGAGGAVCVLVAGIVGGCGLTARRRSSGTVTTA